MKKKRAGATLLLFCVLLPVMLIMVAFAIDYGFILVGQLQLQNAADAGAMAGGAAMTDGSDEPLEVARETAEANFCVGDAIVTDVNGNDVQFGNWDSDTRLFTPVLGVTDAPNAIRVRLERSTARGNPLNLLFAPIMGHQFANIEAQAICLVESGCNGFVGLESATILNNAETDSYESSVGPYNRWGSNRSENGDVCSNGPIFLASGAEIYGDAASGTGSVTVAQGSGAVIHGGRGTTGPIVREPVDFTDAIANNDNDLVPPGPAWNPNFVTSAGDLIIDQGRNVTLPSGTYYFRNVYLRGGSQLGINGEVEIFIQNEMRFDNGTTANQGNIPANFRLNVGSGPVNIQGGNQLYAVIYAPEAEVRLENGSGFFGDIVGRTLNMAGGNGSHYDLSLSDDSAPAGTSSQMVQ